MVDTQKAQSPAATGLSADETNNAFIIRTAESLSKREASLIAAFAMRGVTVHRLSSGGYLACRWNLSRHCNDLPELESFARQVGAAT